jgi:glycosyltransferase involved in cell wall biosynthesis
VKKNILFVINNLHCGGAEKSLITLLQTLDYSKYNVDLYLFKHKGLFLDKIPKQVKLLYEPEGYKYFNMPIKQALFDCLKQRKFSVAYGRVCTGISYKVERNSTRADQKAWKFLSSAIDNLEKEYDSAIAYLEMAPIYFLIDKVKAKNKIGWIHTNYSNANMDKYIDNPYFEKLDSIVTVSDECEKSLKDSFSQLKNKFCVINNILSPEVIRTLAKEKEEIIKDSEYITIITVARLCKVKGIDLAVEACETLVKQGYKLKWFVIGSGNEKENAYYKNFINQKGLQNSFILLGVKENPYSYIEQADIYVQPSRFEGKSIAVEEAKILQKPIIVTNFSTAKDQINNNINGLIVEVDSMSIAQGIIELAINYKLCKKFKDNLSLEELGNEYEIEKLYKLI